MGEIGEIGKMHEVGVGESWDLPSGADRVEAVDAAACVPGHEDEALCEPSHESEALCEPSHESEALCGLSHEGEALCGLSHEGEALCEPGHEGEALCEPGHECEAACGLSHEDAAACVPGHESEAPCGPAHEDKAASSPDPWHAPAVSICCITYNHAPYIRSALDGFLSQRTDFAFEILIHDDASTDGTAEIIREYADRHPHMIKPILRQENQYSKGISNISIFNFPRARGRYIAMCEGDDCWTDPEKLQKQVDYLRANPNCSLCFHSGKIVSVDGSRTEGLMRPYRVSKKVEPEEIVDKSSGYPTASLVFPSWIVKELPDYYLDCPVGDVPMQLMMAAEGYAYYMDEPMCVYRVGVPSSWTSLMKEGDYEKKQERYCGQMEEMYKAFDKATGGRFHSQAVSAARRIYFLTQVNTKKYSQVMKPEYRRYYRELSFRTRFFIRFEILAPRTYRLAQRMFRGQN